MRLINVKTSKLEEHLDEKAPPYAILSHTWGNDCDELSFRDVESGSIDETGVKYVKFRGCCQQAEKDGLDYAWIDTCCIDKTNLVELSEAINSMFRWYQRAKICYAYLSDVPGDENHKMQGSKFQTSRWFQRGWTLQELLAPTTLRFYSLDWRYLGTKGNMCTSITKATGIPRQFLLGIAALNSASVAQRMSWAAHRDTKRKEDLAYCLLGIFDITMPMIYGEGGDRAFFRLQEQIMRTTRDDSILAWGIEMDEQLSGGPSQASAGRILAASPSDFVNSGNIIRRERSLTFTNSVNMSGGSLQAYLSLISTAGDKIIGLLSCGPEGNPNQVIGIPLIKLVGGSSDEYARPRGSNSGLQPAKSGVVPKLVQIKHDNEKDISTDLNTIYYHYEDDEFAEFHLSLVDVAPESCWDKERSLIMSTSKTNDAPLGQILIRLRHGEAGSQDFVILLDFKEQTSGTETLCCVFVCNRNILLGELATNLPSIIHNLYGNTGAWNGFLNLRVTLERVERQPIFVIRPGTALLREASTTIDATVELKKRKLILNSIKILKESENIEIEEEEMKEREENQTDYIKKITEEKTMISLKLRELEDRQRYLIQEGNEKIQELYKLVEMRKKTEGIRHDVSRRWLLTQKQLEELQQVSDLGNSDGIDDVTDTTPLLWAATEGHIEEVKQLLDEGVDIRASAKGGRTPIVTASRNGHVGVTRLLLESGADIEDKGEYGETPLLAATAAGCVDLVKLLLDEGANVEAVDQNGTTALMIAVQERDVALVEMLLATGKNNFDIMDEMSGRTVLDWAMLRGNEAIVKLLHKAKKAKKKKDEDLRVKGLLKKVNELKMVNDSFYNAKAITK
jgi:ankyrin repeat protein